jgi:hypothetical protein
MRTLITMAAAGLAVVAVGIWMVGVGSSATDTVAVSPKATSAATISVWELHNQAHLEFLSVQQIDDQSMIFNEARR